MSKRKVVGPYGAEEWGLKGWRSEGWGPTRWEAQHFAFFPSPDPRLCFSFLFLGFVRGICVALWLLFLIICLKIACLNDVHRTRPHDNHDHDHDNDHQHDTTTTGWRFGGSSPWMGHHPVGPGKDTHGTLGPLRREAVGGPINAPWGEVTHNDGALRRDKRHIFRQTKFEKPPETPIWSSLEIW